ncbi:uncharacterized protein LOC130980503 [Arachis stenosperma]|uniref:uncharacterized protein LOC130980503 n=1 Tax=Arachis stenosperma TaxID=217475 RepID=UPI0025ABF065|nr:uncharacterized protein LOC130980503 [Arachis stenosperma]
MASEDVKSGESAVTKIVTLAEEAKLASREGVVTAAAAPSYAFTIICKFLLASGVAEGVFVDWFLWFEVVDYDAGSAATSREGYDSLYKVIDSTFWRKLVSFCNDHAIQIPDMGASFSDIIRSRCKKDVVTVEHHYRVDIFTSVIDFQLKELNSRFSEQAIELLILSTSLDPKYAFKLFSVCNICNLAKNFYFLDFSE